jgi:hypothetical protein
MDPEDAGGPSTSVRVSNLLPSVPSTLLGLSKSEYLPNIHTVTPTNPLSSIPPIQIDTPNPPTDPFDLPAYLRPMTIHASLTPAFLSTPVTSTPTPAPVASSSDSGLDTGENGTATADSSRTTDSQSTLGHADGVDNDLGANSDSFVLVNSPADENPSEESSLGKRKRTMRRPPPPSTRTLRNHLHATSATTSEKTIKPVTPAVPR